MLLPSLIRLSYPTSYEPTPEDIFSSTLGSIFTDDLQNQHGDDPSTVIHYLPSNPAFPELEFRTADVNGEEQRRKFAHYLWNAGILMAEIVGGRPTGVARSEGGTGWREGEWWLGEEEEGRWNVKGETVLELGAGVGLSGIMSAITGASEVAITDYPAPPILATLTTNTTKNLSEPLRSKTLVHGHKWGDFDTEFAQSHAHHYTRILAADCLWMPHEHESLARSMLHFLSNSPDARVFVIAGFHTGRAKMAPFFEKATREAGLEIEEIFEMDADGKRREWVVERDGGREDISGRKKWLVVARLRRAVTS